MKPVLSRGCQSELLRLSYRRYQELGVVCEAGTSGWGNADTTLTPISHCNPRTERNGYKSPTAYPSMIDRLHSPIQDDLPMNKIAHYLAQPLL